jgi:hypothetical protein
LFCAIKSESGHAQKQVSLTAWRLRKSTASPQSIACLPLKNSSSHRLPAAKKNMGKRRFLPFPRSKNHDKILRLFVNIYQACALKVAISDI